MLEKEPKDSFLNYALALEYQKQGDLNKAIELIEKVIAHDENYLGAYLQLGQCYEECNQPAKALERYKKGCVIAKKQNNNKALSEINQAIFMLEE